MGNAAGSMDMQLGKEGKSVPAPPVMVAPQKQSASPKLPIPAEEELEERFNAVLVSVYCPRLYAGYIDMYPLYLHTHTDEKDTRSVKHKPMHIHT